MTDHLYLHLDRGTAGPRPMAEAYFSTRAGRLLSTVVTYDADYVADPAAFPVSPTLPLFTGGQHADGLPGFLSDCAPDRWAATSSRSGTRPRRAPRVAPSPR